jgi:MFS family permease
MRLDGKNKTIGSVIVLTIIFLAIELLDELVDGVRGAAYPSIRNDLHLDYEQVGLLLTIPNIISSLIEPILGIWGDIGQRQQLILGGGVGFAIALLLVSLGDRFSWLLAAFVLFYPASGCFVSLSQATLDGHRTDAPRAEYGTLGIGWFCGKCPWTLGNSCGDRIKSKLAECIFHLGGTDGITCRNVVEISVFN